MSAPTVPLPGLARRLAAGAEDFLGRPASPRPLAVLRIGLALVLLVQALAIGPSLPELYGEQGIVRWPITHALAPEGVPRVGWLASALAPLGVSADACVRAVFLLYLAGLGGLLVGWHTRPSALAAWLAHLALNTSGAASAYGVDAFANIGLFYCVWMPVGHALSADVLAGRLSGAPSFAARLGLRVVQLHLCIAYLAAGVEKLAGEQWRDGEAVWLALMQPALGQFDFTWLAGAPWAALLACWSTVVVELGYPLFVWPRRTRKAWALATIGLHAGIAAFLGLVSFSAVMAALTLAAFLVSPEPVPRPAARDLAKGSDGPAAGLRRRRGEPPQGTSGTRPGAAGRARQALQGASFRG
jgi:hypothetical protein